MSEEDVAEIESEKLDYKVEIDENWAIAKEISERIAQLDAAVKVYQDRGGWLSEE